MTWAPNPPADPPAGTVPHSLRCVEPEVDLLGIGDHVPPGAERSNVPCGMSRTLAQQLPGTPLVGGLMAVLAMPYDLLLVAVELVQEGVVKFAASSP